MLAAASTLSAQQGTIVGNVFDQATMVPLAGSVVSVVGANVSSRVGADGSFFLPAVNPGSLTIRVTAQGYAASVDQVEVTPDEITFVQFQLLPLSATLNEVLVLSRRGNSPADGVEVPSNRRDSAVTAADLLARQVPGLSFSRTGGMVGSGSRVNIRGINTFTGNNDPVIYLDGVRITEGSTGGSSRTQTPFAVLDQIPASNVKRIRVLRGSSAAARYADSANGVILIETQTGRQD
jgi:TonB-dependent starch-binding outer membrane protein SusC